MHWNVCGNCRVAALVLLAVLPGCRSQNERGEAPQTIVIREGTRHVEQREYDTGDRRPTRIEVVVAEPAGGGSAAAGPSPLTSLVGRGVKVQFRRDALGLTATSNNPMPLTTQGTGGRAVSITGTLRSASGGWLTLEREKTTYWVPQAAILMIETSEASTTAPALE